MRFVKLHLVDGNEVIVNAEKIDCMYSIGDTCESDTYVFLSGADVAINVKEHINIIHEMIMDKCKTTDGAIKNEEGEQDE